MPGISLGARPAELEGVHPLRFEEWCRRVLYSSGQGKPSAVKGHGDIDAVLETPKGKRVAVLITARKSWPGLNEDTLDGLRTLNLLGSPVWLVYAGVRKTSEVTAELQKQLSLIGRVIGGPELLRMAQERGLSLPKGGQGAPQRHSGKIIPLGDPHPVLALLRDSQQTDSLVAYAAEHLHWNEAPRNVHRSSGGRWFEVGKQSAFLATATSLEQSAVLESLRKRARGETLELFTLGATPGPVVERDLALPPPYRVRVHTGAELLDGSAGGSLWSHAEALWAPPTEGTRLPGLKGQDEREVLGWLKTYFGGKYPASSVQVAPDLETSLRVIHADGSGALVLLAIDGWLPLQQVAAAWAVAASYPGPAGPAPITVVYGTMELSVDLERLRTYLPSLSDVTRIDLLLGDPLKEAAPASSGLSSGEPDDAEPGADVPTARHTLDGPTATPQLDPDHVQRGRAEDHLDRGAEVEQLARMMVSRDLSPPLSIALLGDWGSGKSTFMDLLHQRVQALSETARDADSADSAPGESSADTTTCRAVCQVHFNAWHYNDDDLWASLVGHLFESLSAHMHPREAAEGVQKEAERRQQHDELEAVLDSKTGALAAERARLDRAQETLQHLRDQTRAGREAARLDLLFSEDGRGRQLAEKARAVGWHRAVQELTELRLFREALVEQRFSFLLRGVGGALLKSSLSGLLRALWPTLVSVLAVVLGKTLFGIPAGLSTVDSLIPLALAANLFQLGHKEWASLSGLQGDIDNALQAGARKLVGELKEVVPEADLIADASLQPFEDWLRRQQERIERAEEEVQQLEAQRRFEEPAERLRRFITERGSTDDYRIRQGVVTLVRRDLEQLERNLGEYWARVRRGETPDHAFSQVIQKTDEWRPSGQLMERIVLYIDDLDRCDPEQVVAVLKAIHMLLGFQLFVVVVAVDTRWLIRALELEYANILQGADSTQSLTPVDYLEKIFQLAVRLPEPTDVAFKRLMESITGAAQIDNTPAATQDGHEPTGPATPEVSASLGSSVESSEAPTAAEAPAPQSTEPEPTATETARLEADKTREAVGLRPDEQAILQQMRPFVPSPRLAKRLVNVHRLVRGRRVDKEPTDYRATLLMLGVGVGFASCWKDFVAALQEDSVQDQSLVEFLDDQLTTKPTPLHPLWTEIERLIHRDVPALQELQALRVRELARLVPLVQRHSIRLGAPRDC